MPYRKIVFSLILSALLISCKEKAIDRDRDSETVVIKSDLENLTNDEESFVTDHSAYTLKNGKRQSTDKSRSGKYSIKLDSLEPYGMGCQISDPVPGEFINVRIWQHEASSNGSLIAALSGASVIPLKTERAYTKTDSSEWVLHYLDFIVPEGVETIDFYVFVHKQTAYFDDFEIKRSFLPKNQIATTLQLQIPVVGKQDLDKNTEKSVNAGMIKGAYKDYVDAQLWHADEWIDIKMRLKGDWPDHIHSGKTSYRIKVEGNNGYQGLKSFSVQHPKTRNYLFEWVVHKMAEEEDVLTTTYDFLNVEMNNLYHGVYALEEHFDKQLIEHRNRREGPILKFDESGFWDYMYRKYQGKHLSVMPHFESSTIAVFKENRTLKSGNLRSNFEEGRTLLELFRSNSKNIEDIFDIEQLAKFYALVELTDSDHALRWHNRRFYFNPITQKLEHILYDAGPFGIGNPSESLMKYRLSSYNQDKELTFDNAVLTHPEFKFYYMNFIKEMATDEYLDQFFTEYDSSISVFEGAIVLENPLYEFEKNKFYERAALLRAEFDEVDSLWTAVLDKNIDQHSWTIDKKYEASDDQEVIEGIAVKAYVQHKDSARTDLLIENYHLHGVEIFAVEIDSGLGDYIKLLDQAVYLKPYEKTADFKSLSMEADIEKIYYKADNNPDNFVRRKVIPWSKPSKTTSRMELSDQWSVHADELTIVNNVVVFQGDIQIGELIHIPKQYKVKILPGTHIEFINEGGLIINNSLNAIGKEGNKITIESKSETSNGLTVLKGGKCDLKYINFKNLTNLNYKNWVLTSGITFYECDVKLSHLSIDNAQSEDALNLIRSTFMIENLSVDKTLSDGFDADFCSGSLINSHFSNTGNDAVDVSGTIVKIENLIVENCGDKALSAGEDSDVEVNGLNVNKTVSGVAAKDLSSVKLVNVVINEATFGLLAFQKKGEFGSATIQSQKTVIKGAYLPVVAEQSSQIEINGHLYEGNCHLSISWFFEFYLS
ncbi:MAG: CotH kinase family protein [Crocinitomicaceae bacterium]